jgi:hypothetical protein
VAAVSERILVEGWHSDDAEAREVHIFRDSDQRGWAYVLGYNPDLFDEEDVRSFLRRHGIDWPAVRPPDA